MRRALDKLRDLYSRHKAIGTVRHLAVVATGRVWPLVYRRRQEIVMRIDREKTTEVEHAADMKVSRIGAADLDDLRNFIRANNSDAPAALRRLDCYLSRGYHGIIGRLGSDVIGHAWCHDRTLTPHPQMRLHAVTIAAREVFAFELFLAPTKRARHGGIQFIYLLQRHLIEAGYDRAYSIIFADNKRSLRVHRATGWEHHSVPRDVRIFCSSFIECDGRIARYESDWF